MRLLLAFRAHQQTLIQKASEQVLPNLLQDSQQFCQKRVRPTSPPQTGRQNHAITYILCLQAQHQTVNKQVERKSASCRSPVRRVTLRNQDLLKRSPQIQNPATFLGLPP